MSQPAVEGSPAAHRAGLVTRAAHLRAFLLGLLVLIVAGPGCSGLDPQKPDPPINVDGPCGQPLAIFTPLANGLVPVGTDTTLDLATWNLEFFPLRLPGDFNSGHPLDASRQQQAAAIVNTLGLDVIAIEEVSDTLGFRQFLALVPNYGGYLAPERRGTNYQRVGFMYRKDQVTVRSAKLIFTNDTEAFPRSPVETDLLIASNGKTYELHLIVVHLKAGGDSDDDRRRAAAVKLKTYLDQQAAVDSTANYLIAGDWNDVLNSAPVSNSFPAFLNDPNDYQFLDMPLVGKKEFASHPTSGGVLIDHLMVNRAACPDFNGGRVTTLRLDLIVSGYSNVSDHRPVMVQAPIFK